MSFPRPSYWTLDRILETAEKCRTYRQFYMEYPLAYGAARHNDWLGVVRSHCGWREINRVTIDDFNMHPLPLKEVVEEPGCLLMSALEDPRWPLDTIEKPLKEEIL